MKATEQEVREAVLGVLASNSGLTAEQVAALKAVRAGDLPDLGGGPDPLAVRTAVCMHAELKRELNKEADMRRSRRKKGEGLDTDNMDARLAQAVPPGKKARAKPAHIWMGTLNTGTGDPLLVTRYMPEMVERIALARSRRLAEGERSSAVAVNYCGAMQLLQAMEGCDGWPDKAGIMTCGEHCLKDSVMRVLGMRVVYDPGQAEDLRLVPCGIDYDEGHNCYVCCVRDACLKEVLI